ncbi:MAG: hypothetical protein L0H75_04625 [Nitrosospira sp.]|nr:hypothetical protein [Nitrosospira sp.]MDN5935450.1 hypothetical protein [Nitrosospira sp.]
MPKSPHSRLFIRYLATTVLIGITIAVALVVIVDPYNQYRIVARPGFNLIKPGLTRYQNEIKLTQAAAMRPDALILGHSRAEIGFDPSAPVFSQYGVSAYNLAIPGTGIDNAREQIRYLHQIDIKPKVIVIGVEFLDFMTMPQKTALAIPQVRRIDDRHPVTRWFWRFDTLFSLASVKDAVYTLLIQHNNERETITSRGFNPLNEYGSMVLKEGYYAFFQQRALENTETYLKKAKGSLNPADFAHLRAILDMATGSHSDVKLIIYPYHAQILALFEEAGLWPAFEEWKSLIIREVSAARQRHPTARVTLLDFSGYGSYRCEKIPKKGDLKSTTRWYWEAGHFKKELGAVVLDSVFSPAKFVQKVRTGADTTAVFGFQLDESNRVLNQQRVSLERSECMRIYPELFVDAANLVAGARKRHGAER